jgi:hypothetical protein
MFTVYKNLQLLVQGSFISNEVAQNLQLSL